jgi:hypothetical protein
MVGVDFKCRKELTNCLLNITSKLRIAVVRSGMKSADISRSAGNGFVDLLASVDAAVHGNKACGRQVYGIYRICPPNSDGHL